MVQIDKVNQRDSLFVQRFVIAYAFHTGKATPATPTELVILTIPAFPNTIAAVIIPAMSAKCFICTIPAMFGVFIMSADNAVISVKSFNQYKDTGAHRFGDDRCIVDDYTNEKLFDVID
jgi:hypothetical protein